MSVFLPDDVSRLSCRVAAIGVSLLSCLPARALDPEPLPFPVYVACRITGDITIDGKLSEAAWRETSLGWGMSHSIEPNTLCPDPTLFRIGYDDEWVYLSLAAYKRRVQDDIPEHVWKPRETDIMDMQAVPRHNRMRGIIPPTNTADVLISREGRTVTLHFEPPKTPTAKVHDSLGERGLDLELTHAYVGSLDDALWTVEVRVGWDALGFPAPGSGDDWALNLYRDIRFFSNWSFISWMRRWAKAEYSRYNMVDRFGRIIFQNKPDLGAIEKEARRIAAGRGPVRVFTPDAYVRVDTGGRVVRQWYADRLRQMLKYAGEIFRDRTRIGNDLPYHPFFTERKPREHLAKAQQKLGWLHDAMTGPVAWDDPASGVARIAHAIPKAREGLYTYKKERLYRGLPE